MSSSSRAIANDRTKAGSVIRGNTLLYDNTGGGLIPAIDVIMGGADEAGVVIENNIVAAAIVSTLSKVYDNYVFGNLTSLNTPAIYAALFTGTAAQMVTTAMASAADLMARATPTSATLWPVGRVRRGAMSGYFDYSTGVEDAPWDETGWAASGLWGDVALATTNTSYNGTKRQVTSVSATGVQVRVTGGTSPTLTLYDTNGTTVIVSGVTSVCATANQWVMPSDTSSNSGVTTTTVTITAGALRPGI